MRMDPAFWTEAPPVNGTAVVVAFFGGITLPVPTGTAGAAGVVLTAIVVGTATGEDAGTPGAEEAGGAGGGATLVGGLNVTTVEVTLPTGQLVTVGAQERTV